jgi:hypothetical protein
MQNVRFLVLAIILAGISWTATSQSANGGSPVSVRIPPFALSPGERISGVKLTASAGRIYAGCRPNRWTCDESGSTIHCYCLHQTYATAISGMLPEFIIRDNESGRLSLQASVEFIDNNGKEYSRDIREGDLIIK